MDEMTTCTTCGREYNRIRLSSCPACRAQRSTQANSPALPMYSGGVSTSMVTTLPHLPGYSIVRALGPVSVLSGSSGFTATSKGNTALNAAMKSLRDAAGGMRANAIVGLNASAFGAAGGITSAFGGDAVGVLLVGTAVLVEPEKTPPPSP
jgi:uncharacterized protein YbjQ (UPF0145 family)